MYPTVFVSYMQSPFVLLFPPPRVINLEEHFYLKFHPPPRLDLDSLWVIGSNVDDVVNSLLAKGKKSIRVSAHYYYSF